MGLCTKDEVNKMRKKSIKGRVLDLLFGKVDIWELKNYFVRNYPYMDDEDTEELLSMIASNLDLDELSIDEFVLLEEVLEDPNSVYEAVI